MAIALKLDTATGRLAQLLAADPLEIDVIEPRSGGHLIIGATLGVGDEVRLGVAGETVRVMGDFAVDGSSTVTVNETVTGTFTANGDVNLGSGDGDTINLGAGGDTVNLLDDLTVGAGLVGVGSGITDYLNGAWLQAVNDNGPDADAYNLRASGTNAGAYSIGVDPALLANATATDLMTALDQLDAAISAGGGESLQDTYAIGNTISVTAGNGDIAFSNSTDATDILSLSRTFVGAGEALSIAMGPGNEAVTGRGLEIISGTGATGAMAFINNQGSGNAIQVQDGGTDVFIINGTGSFALTAQAASTMSTAAGNLTMDAIAGELVFDDVGNSGLTLSQAADRTLDQTAAGEVLNGATSAIGAINRLARAIDEGGVGSVSIPIENAVTIAAGDVVAQSTTSGRVTQGNANGDTNARNIGIALVGGTGDAGGTVEARIALSGSFVSDSGAAFTAGNALFAPDGTGRPTATAPANTGDVVQRVGWAHSATEYVLDFGPAVVL